MEIVKLMPDDVKAFEDLIDIFLDVFELEADRPSTEYLRGLLSKPDFMVFVAKINGQVVGGLTVYVLHHYYQPRPIAYIYDVGVATAFQNKGIGKALIAHVCDHCREHGFSEAYVEAEADDADAVAFYRRTGPGSEMYAVHFTYPSGIG